MPVIALCRRCHLEGPLTATAAGQEVGSPGSQEALQPPTEGTLAPKQPWSCGFKGEGCQGHPGGQKKEIWQVPLIHSPFLV